MIMVEGRPRLDHV